MLKNKIVLIALLTLLAGCGGSSIPVQDNDDDTGGNEQEFTLSNYVYIEGLGVSHHMQGYIEKDGVEILYGENIFVYRKDGGEWSYSSDDKFYVFGVEVLSPDHWVVSVVRNMSSMNVGYYIEETTDGGMTWSSAPFESDIEVSEYVSAVEYNYADDEVYVAVDIGIAVSGTPVGEFEVIESSGSVQGLARDFILNPSRDEIWWVGALALAAPEPPIEDAHVKRFSLNGDSVTAEDFTEEIGLTKTFGGMIHPNDPNTVFIAGREGIVRTETSGTQWQHVFDEGQVANVVYSEINNNLYWSAMTSEGIEVYCSQDLADTWISTLVTNELPYYYERVTLTETNGTDLLIGLDRAETYAVAVQDIPCE